MELELFKANIEATSPYNDGWTALHYKKRAEKIEAELELKDE
jgi:hypothetical protein